MRSYNIYAIYNIPQEIIVIPKVIYQLSAGETLDMDESRSRPMSAQLYKWRSRDRGPTLAGL